MRSGSRALARRNPKQWFCLSGSDTHSKRKKQSGWSLLAIGTITARYRFPVRRAGGQRHDFPTHNPTHKMRCLRPSAYFGSPRGLCHGRGREFESRRPRHSFQRTCIYFSQTIEDAKRPRHAALSRPFCSVPPCHVATAFCVAAPKDSGTPEEKTNDSTAACASCFAGLIACV